MRNSLGECHVQNCRDPRCSSERTGICDVLMPPGIEVSVGKRVEASAKRRDATVLPISGEQFCNMPLTWPANLLPARHLARG